MKNPLQTLQDNVLRKKTKFSRNEALFLLLLFVITVLLRAPQLGYSHFYGDETKVLYLRKDTAASDFMLNQRKGPVQFVAAWGMEKITGEFDELSTRIPFLIAGVLAVFAFYFMIRELFDWQVAGIASLIFSVNGFFIAFSRTVQYQSFLMLFGFISIWAVLKSSHKTSLISILARALHFLKKLVKKRQRKIGSRQIHLTISGVFLALAYLAHWDALFFSVVVGAVLIRVVRSKSQVYTAKEVVLFFLIPFLAVLALFFVPYFSQGYFTEHVSGYISRRLSGSNQLTNSSLYTFYIYNNHILYFLPFLFAPLAFSKGFKKMNFNLSLVLVWFLVSFIAFEIIFSNPGTHILNYFLPLIVLSAVGIHKTYEMIKKSKNKQLHWAALAVFITSIVLMSLCSARTYIPALNKGYPWKQLNEKKGIYASNNQLFLYGFPYYRGWDKVRDWVDEKGGIRSYYTNDNVTIAEYYLEGIDVNKPHPDQMPQYYFWVDNSQEFSGEIESFDEMLRPTTILVHTKDL